MRDAGDAGGPGRLSSGDYHASVEGRAIAGLVSDLSGLTFSTRTGTLFAVANRPVQILELSRDGLLLRRIPVDGAGDLEAITHAGGDRFIIADEASDRLIWVTISPETRRVDLSVAPDLVLNGRLLPNLGVEGLSWDRCHSRLFVAHEMLPMRVTRIDGVTETDTGGVSAQEATEWRPLMPLGHSFADLSSVSVLDGSGNLVLLSHLTSALAEFSPKGRPLGLLLLWAGHHGLQRTIPQAEGIALDDEGTIFVVSEPNLFYRFSRKAADGWQPAPCEARAPES